MASSSSASTVPTVSGTLSIDDSLFQAKRGANFDLDKAHHPNWMSMLPDSAGLSSVSLPGTHDTMSYPLTMSPFAQTQNHDLTTQLNAGIRYLDIRLRNTDGVLYTCHRFVYTGRTWAYVLETVGRFLDADPSEGIFIRVKKEAEDAGTGKCFTQLLLESLTANTHWLQGPLGGFTSIPTVEQIRGKFLLFTDFPDASPEWGIAWDEPGLVDLEDDWRVDTVFDMEKKWKSIKEHLDKTANVSPADERLYLTHTSGSSLTVFPRVVSVGDLLQKGMNQRTLEKLRDGTGKRRVGVVITDFPGKDLVDAIIEMNNGLRETDGTNII